VVDKRVKRGTIVKQRRGLYSAIFDDETVLESITAYDDDNEESLTRLTSTCLRHDIELAYVVHQLEKVDGDLTNFAKSVARCLKKYIKDGTKVKGEECPECSSALIRAEGCVLCKTCGWTKCS